MGEKTSTRHGIDAEGLVGAQQLAPVDFLHILIELVGILGEEILEGFQHFESRTHLIINAVHELLVAFADDGAVHGAHVLGTQSLDLGGQHVFKSGGRFRDELVVVFHWGNFSAKIEFIVELFVVELFNC